MSAAAVATRLARREVVRRPWRTAIVMLLVIVPVVILTAFAVGMRTNDRTLAEKFSAEWGSADILSGGQLDVDLPEGTTIRPARFTDLRFKTGDAVRDWARLTDMTIEGDDAAILIENMRGEMPSGPDEVFLTTAMAERAGVDVGDVLVLERPVEAELTVSGIATWRSELGRRAIHVDGSADKNLLDRLPEAEGYASMELIDLPTGAEPSPQLLQELVNSYSPNRFIDPWDQGPSAQTAIVWTWVAGAVSFVIVGVVIAAAFAVTARRQLRLIGQLMGNGASASTLRATLFLQGSIIGFLGGIVGVAVALVGIHLGQPVIENVVGRRIDAYDIRFGDIAPIVVLATLAATVAALVPARMAIQTSVLQALAGRRPVGPYPARVVVRGALAAGAGLILLAVATAAASGTTGEDGAWLFVLTGIAGAIAVLLGTCAMSPAIIGWLEPLAGRLRGTNRLAARSVARQRTRTGAVVSAVAVVAAGAVAASTVWITALAEMTTPSPWELPQDRVVVDAARWNEELGRTEYLPLDDALIAQILDVVPDADLHNGQVAVVAPSDGAEGLGSYPHYGGPFKVADEQLLDALAIAPHVRDALDAEGLVLPTWEQVSSAINPPGSTAEVVLSDDYGEPALVTPAALVAAEDLAWTAGGLITEQRADELGLLIESGSVTFVADAPLDDVQFDLLSEIQHDLWMVTDEEAAAVNISFNRPQWIPSQALVTSGIVLVATLFVLGVVGLGLALSAAETKDERDVLAAMGARPRTLRNLAAAKALVLAAIGILVGIPLGFVPTYVVAKAGNSGSDLTVLFPWLQVLILVVAVPVIAAAATMAASGISLRVRPVQASTMAFD